MSDQFGLVRQLPGFNTLFDELKSALSLYWETATEVLQGGGISLLDPPEGYFSLEHNFFSAIFLYSYYRAEIPHSRRVLYAAINQCFRGMVTGCDNLLDDEYKRTLETNLPAKAWRFRSVLDIMVSEHVMFNLMVSASRRKEIREDLLIPAVDAALKALTRSGAQEAGEEGGTKEALHPGKILKTIHHYKTGILFQSPWAVPAVLEILEAGKTKPVMEGLYRIGIGCQILDDLVDLQRDILQKRHNYVASLIYHHQGQDAWARLRDMTYPANSVEAVQSLIGKFSEPIKMAVTSCRQYLNSGIIALLGSDSPALVQSVISILSHRIGTDAYLDQYP
jgi:hypothetical protein